jgi:hypothetical protein
MDRADDWPRLVEEIRVRHRNRPKMLEILDRLQERPIVDAGAAGKRRRMAT